MSNVLDDEKQRQICALGRLGWTLSRIQEATGSRRETISGYLKLAGIAELSPRTFWSFAGEFSSFRRHGTATGKRR